MFDQLSSLRSWQPRFYTGGASRMYLALLADVVGLQKPRRIVVAGSGDGQVLFAMCQAAQEHGVQCECIAMGAPGREPETDDSAWQAQREYGAELYPQTCRFIEAADAPLPDGVDLLVIDDVDSSGEVAAALDTWRERLSPTAVVALHGALLEREDAPLEAWRNWVGGRASAEFGSGIGLALAAKDVPPDALQIFFAPENRETLSLFYEVAAARIQAAARASAAEKESASFQVRQVWLDSLLANSWSAQEVMDHQARMIAELERKFAHLHDDRLRAQEILDEQAKMIADLRSDRQAAQAVLDQHAETLRSNAEFIRHLQQELTATEYERARLDLLAQTQAEQLRDFDALKRECAKGQLVIDSQQEQLQHWINVHNYLNGELDRVKADLKQRKQLIAAAKQACRRKGKCFQIPTGPKVRRPLGERVLRELRRVPRNLGLAKEVGKPATSNGADKIEAAPEQPKAAAPPADRYGEWIATNEPDAAGLQRQREDAARLPVRPQLSVIVPVFNTPREFLDDLIESLVSQTYDNWQLCIAEGGSDRAETIEALRAWEKKDARVAVTYLPQNLGISENTNAALKLASGDFILLADHDDLLPPFALYEMASAIAANPEADIFYSDEDRLSAAGKRHTPFFKPDWSPALLTSFMYIGHLTAYRRTLVESAGGFRKEYDLSQDYDLTLRASERARGIIHVPHVCYHWREHSASANMGAKPHARATNLAALRDAMKRRGFDADVIEYPTANRARLKIRDWPRVSLVIPTDSPTRAQACLNALPQSTDYPDLEIVVVANSRLTSALASLNPPNVRVQLVAYDQPFNFSEKCNTGAAAATGSRVIFFNDDVEAEQPDWIQNLIEQLENREIGAVAPKLLYETGKIQHAGLVSGVRGFAGTAFHQRDANSIEHFNMAQSLRDVSALSGACMAMRRDDFLRLGGFNAIDTPIAHSDFDLCFRIRDAGMRCVYTPFATLRHVGHVSLRAAERARSRKPHRDKANLFLLQRWAGYTTYDPYFPDNMRDWLYHDSPTPIRMWGRNDDTGQMASPDLLFISHDLTLSGAPILLFQLAEWSKRNGMFVTVVAPETGPLAQRYQAAGIPLIVDPLVMTGHESFVKLARDFDCIVGNTIRCAPAMHAMRNHGVPLLWWLHETKVGEHFLREDGQLRSAVPIPDLIFTPSERTASVYRPFRGEREVRCVRYGIPDLAGQSAARPTRRDRVQFLVIGSVEPRKGQDVFVDALGMLPHDVRDRAQFHIAGRVMDPEFGAPIQNAAKEIKTLEVSGAVSHDDALSLLRDTDVLVCSSRDEAMPVTILEALSLGKTVLSTTVGGVPEFLSDGHDAILVRPDDARALAEALTRLIAEPELRQKLAANGRATFEQNFTMERFGEEFRAILQEVTQPSIVAAR